MIDILYGLFYLAVAAAVVAALVYVYRTRPRKIERRATVAELPKLVTRVAEAELGSQLEARLAEREDALLVTTDDRGVNLQFDRRSSIDDFVPRLKRLAKKEGLTLLLGEKAFPFRGEDSFPEITLPPGTEAPEAVAVRLFQRAYDADETDAVGYQAVLHRVPPEGRRA